MPAKGGRSSVEQGNDLFSLLLGEMSEATPEFLLELIPLCYHLAKYNGDVSYAVDNVVQLSNTPYKFMFLGDGITEEDSARIRELVEVTIDEAYSGGINSLINDLIVQTVVSGAISYEAIPSKSLDTIQRIVLVDPYNIRFKYNSANYDYEPYQKVKGGMDLKKLNPTTYKYHASRRINSNPYGIPPFIAALEGIELEKDMMCNMRQIIKKLGVFGFLSVLLTPPARQQGETPEQYYARCEAFLKSQVPEIEKGFASGLTVGFKNAHEFKVEANDANIHGARELFNLISEYKMAGLKQDPLMLGRNFNVAETMARVIMAKLTTQITNYQEQVGLVISHAAKLIALLNGYNVSRVKMQFEPPMIGDKVREQEARYKTIENNKILRDTGVISQEQYAVNVGYDKPHAPGDVNYMGYPDTDHSGIEGDEVGNPSDETDIDDATSDGAAIYSIAELVRRFTKGLPEFQYTHEGCGHTHSLDAEEEKRRKKLTEYQKAYAAEVVALYREATNKMSLKISELLYELSPNATLQQVTDKVFHTLYTEWEASFTRPKKAIIRKWISRAYRFFRGDLSVFGGQDTITNSDGTKVKVPKPSFTVEDVRAVSYFENMDEFYLGRFITDADTRKAITKFIKDEYLKGNTPIGQNDEVVSMFRGMLNDTLDLEDWKIRRIIDTTVNRMRNYGAISMMHQARVTNFRIVGIADTKQCKYCANMNGRVFSLAPAYNQMTKATQGMPLLVKEDTPFITSVFKGNDGLQRLIGMDSGQVQALGIAVPPYHGHCRCMAVVENYNI